MNAEILIDGRSWKVILDGEDVSDRLKMFRIETSMDIESAGAITIWLRENPARTVIEDAKVFMIIGKRKFELVERGNAD